MKREEKTLVIIPAYNEEKSLPSVIKSIAVFAPRTDILVVNDASEDRTSEAARSVKISSQVIVVDVPCNLGIGGAMQVGFIYARDNGYDVALQIDGDGQHSPKYIKDLKNAIYHDGVDMAVGSRFISLRGFKGFFPRRLGIKYFSILIKLLTGIKILDVTSGFRAFSKRAIGVFAEYYPHDYPEVESFVVLKKLNLKVMEKPVAMKRRKHGVSTISWLDGIYYVVRVSLGVLVSSLRKYDELKEVKNA